MDAIQKRGEETFLCGSKNRHKYNDFHYLRDRVISRFFLAQNRNVAGLVHKTTVHWAHEL